MKKVSLLVGSLIIVAMVSGCMMIDRSTDRSDRDDSGYGSHGGHSHH
jgi:hypothetical protein